ncbi:MAG: FibroRumin system radical SAM peptide maturase [Ruminococcus sp.]|nr:FibroRumin system radical SAM peptide maturase [Ruminococcus sp.]
MIKLSRFTHTFDLGDSVALYHSLRMKPVYLERDTYQSLQEWLASSFCIDLNNAPKNIKDEVQLLRKCKILTISDDEDDKVLAFIRSRITRPAISVCYMILSEQCNLACKYCFLGNNDTLKRKQFELKNMSEDTADKAIDFYLAQLKKSGLNFEHQKPVVIFYGGEPMVNYPTLLHIASKLNELKKTEPILKNLELTMVTNGILLNEERIERLNELHVGIGISIDGFSEEDNSMRVDRFGKPIFNELLEILSLLKKHKADFSLSVTLNEETIKHKDSVLKLIKEYNVRSFGFNIMMSSDTFIVPNSYNEAAAKFIIDEFIELRKLGIYEDRMMRKLDAFTKAQVYYSDCAATAGGQIVIAPNGQVGICHGCLYNKKYFVTDVNDIDFNCIENEYFIEWSQLTPINHEECLDCSALGICGGGCPINAMYLKEGNTIHSIDTRFCTHSKMTLDFLIRDLYRIICDRRKKDD